MKQSKSTKLWIFFVSYGLIQIKTKQKMACNLIHRFIHWGRNYWEKINKKTIKTSFSTSMPAMYTNSKFSIEGKLFSETLFSEKWIQNFWPSSLTFSKIYLEKWWQENELLIPFLPKVWKVGKYLYWKSKLFLLKPKTLPWSK